MPGETSVIGELIGQDPQGNPVVAAALEAIRANNRHLADFERFGIRGTARTFRGVREAWSVQPG